MTALTPEPSVDRRLVIYHTSDVHDRRGFGTRLASLVEPGALLLDSGDALRGSSTVYVPHEAIADEFRAAPYRAQAVGNREFHYLHSCMLARARSMPMPWVCSNLIDLRGREPAFARELTLRVQDVDVRLFALLAPQYRTGSGWERLFGWRFLDPHRALVDMLAQRNGSTITLLLSHLGLDADRSLAGDFPQLAAILGGHSHDCLTAPAFERGVPIVHAGAYARYAGRLELALRDGKTSVASYRLIPLLADSVAR